MPGLREALQALHRCDREVYDLARRRQLIPEEVSSAEAAAQAAREAVEAERSALQASEHTRREKEGELQDCEARRDKFQGQTMMVKTNPEYTALLSEIETVNARISEVEEEILVAMERVDELTAHLERFEREKKSEENERLIRAAELREQLQEVERQIDARDALRDEILSGLTPQAKLAYERALKSLGSGSALIAGRACGGCHRDIPYEVINRVLASELQTCPHCRRVMVAEDA